MRTICRVFARFTRNMAATLKAAAIISLCLPLAACQVLDSEYGCVDHLSLGLSCENMPNFCVEPEARVICPKFCGFCANVSVKDTGCSFEKQTFCAWTSENKTVMMEWTVVSAASGSQTGGPLLDHTTDSDRGHYIMTTTDGSAIIPEAMLQSATLKHGSHHCLKVWYCFTSTSGELFVQRQVSGVRADVLRTVKAPEAEAGHWRMLIVDVDPYVANFSLLIVADTGSYSGSPIAVDDIELSSGPCPSSSPTPAGVSSTPVAMSSTPLTLSLTPAALSSTPISSVSLTPAPYLSASSSLSDVQVSLTTDALAMPTPTALFTSTSEVSSTPSSTPHTLVSSSLTSTQTSPAPITSLPTSTTVTTTTTTTTMATTTHKLSCRTHWVMFQDSCYLAVLHESPANEAKLNCERNGGYLVEIQSAAENDFMKTLAQLYHGDEFWMGLERIPLEDVFVFMRSHQQPSYTHWNPGEHNVGENCARFVASLNGRWRDSLCDYKHRSVCETPAQQADAPLLG